MKHIGEILADMGLVVGVPMSVVAPSERPRTALVTASSLPETIDACRRAFETAPRRTIRRREP